MGGQKVPEPMVAAGKQPETRRTWEPARQPVFHRGGLRSPTGLPTACMYVPEAIPMQ